MRIATATAAWYTKRVYVFLFLLTALAILALQLPWISRPPFDCHAFRQAQTLSTIELFARDGIELTHAKTNYVGEPGVFVLEFPLFQTICALFYNWFGPHVWLVRLVNLLFTFGNAGLAFAIGKRLFSREAGFAAMVIYFFAPLNLVYMASTLIDLSAIFFSLAAFLFALRILRPNSEEGSAGQCTWALFAVTCLTTALIKTLYLFPTCVLLGSIFLAERKFTARVVAIGGWMLFSLGLFYFWLRHGQKLNDASYFTRGISAKTLIGFKALTSLNYYRDIVRIISFHLTGPAGALLSAFGLWAAVARGAGEAQSYRSALGVLVASLVGYYLLFSKANGHDYYSLAISPYACLLAGFGVVEVVHRAAASRFSRLAAGVKTPAVTVFAAILSALVFVKPVLFGKKSRLAPEPHLQELRTLSEGRFEPYSYGIVFVAPDPPFPLPANIGTDVPAALYATRLRGTSRLVANSSSALSTWNEIRPHYRHLKYVVFYGLKPPEEIVQICRETIAFDEPRKWFAFRVE